MAAAAGSAAGSGAGSGGGGVSAAPLSFHGLVEGRGAGAQPGERPASAGAEKQPEAGGVGGGVREPAALALWEVSVDVGNTGVKVAVRDVTSGDGGVWTVKSMATDGADVRRVFGGPRPGLGARLRTLVFDVVVPSAELGTVNQLVRVSFSLSGDVKHGEAATVRRSFALARAAGADGAFDGWVVSDSFVELSPAPSVAALNDAAAAGLGVLAATRRADGPAVTFPALVLVLGTFPAVSVVDIGRQIVIHAGHGGRSDWGATVGTRDGKVELRHALGKEAFETLGDAAVFSGRVGRGLARLLQLYARQFQWLPSSIVVAGGLANVVDVEAATRELGELLQQEPLPVTKRGAVPAMTPVVVTGAAGKRLLHDGAALYLAERQGIAVALDL